MKLPISTRRCLDAYVKLTDVIITEREDKIVFSTPQETWEYECAEDVDTFVNFELDCAWENVERKQIEREMWNEAWEV